MFSVGDKIVYPMYGAGVIEDIEEKEVMGNKNLYYILRIPVGNLKITVSAKKAEELGIRDVSSSEDVMSIINEVSPISMPDNWNVRYKENMDRIKTGDLNKVVEVFKTLISRESKKSLSSAEKKMLGTTKQIILSEIIVSHDICKEEAEEILLQNTFVTI